MAGVSQVSIRQLLPSAVFYVATVFSAFQWFSASAVRQTKTSILLLWIDHPVDFDKSFLSSYIIELLNAEYVHATQ